MPVFKIGGGEIEPKVVVMPPANFLALKSKIEAILDVKVSRQKLMCNGEEVMDHLPINHYGMFFDPGLVLDVKPLDEGTKFTITVKSSIGDFTVKVRETDLVSDLERKMKKHGGVLCQNIRLYRLSKEMKSDIALSKYYVCEGCTVQMEWMLHTEPH